MPRVSSDISANELFNAGRFALLLIILGGIISLAVQEGFQLLALAAIPIGMWAVASRNASVAKRFYDKRYEALWKGCEE